MKNRLNKLREWLFLPVSRRKALQIAQRTCAPDARQMRVSDRKPSGVSTYDWWGEPCWYVLCPWNDGEEFLRFRSQRLVVISKASGQVLYHGSANDEG